MEPRKLTPYILRALAQYQIDERRVNLQTLVDDLEVRRADVRRAMTALHEQGFVDIVSFKLSMNGFAVGMSLLDKELPPLRRITSITVAA